MKRQLKLLVGLLLLASCSDRISQEEGIPSPATAQLQSYVPGKTTVRLSEELASEIESSLASGTLATKSTALNAFVDRLGVTSIKRVFSDDERYIKRQHEAGLHLWYTIEYDPSKAIATRAVDDFMSVAGIEYAEPVMRIRTLAEPDDPLYRRQWHLVNSKGVDINLASVWEEKSTGSPSVIVGVVDGGIDPDHEDLQLNAIPARSGGSFNFVDNSYKIVGDDHGTHVAGIIAATRNNAKGVAGIAGGDLQAGRPGVQLLSCQVFSGEETGNTAEAIRYACDNGAVIAQNSWGYVVDTDEDGVISDEELAVARKLTIGKADKAAVDYFIRYAGCDADGNQRPDSPMKGGVVIFAAGNDGIPYGAPGNYDPVIAVGSVTSTGARSPFSNYGDWVDICAPGSSILSCIVDGYGTMSGTSMSCPMVSGAAALVLSVRGGVGFTNRMLEECLVRGADPYRISARDVGPMLDVHGAVNYTFETAPNAIRSIEATGHSNSIEVSWSVPAKADGNPAYAAVVFVASDASLLRSFDPANPPRGVKMLDVSTKDIKVGGKATAVVRDLDFASDYHVTVAPYNYGPVFGAYPAPVKVRTGENNPPTITMLSQDPNPSVRQGHSLVLSFSITDPDHHRLSVQHTAGSMAEIWRDRGDGLYSLTIQGSKADPGEYSFMVHAEDPYGASADFSQSYRILQNHPPVTGSPLADKVIYLDDSATVIPLDDNFSDPDGDELMYSVEGGSESVVYAAAANGVLILTPRSTGISSFTVVVKDPAGKTASQGMMVRVRRPGEEVSVYPTQVNRELHVATGEQKTPTSISVFNAAGATVLESSQEASAFEPAIIDMGSFAPGRYSVRVGFDGKTFTNNVVKL